MWRRCASPKTMKWSTHSRRIGCAERRDRIGQGTKISRWGVAALPLSVFVGVVLGAGVGAAVANIGIGVAIGAGFGVGVGVCVTVAVFVFRSSE